MYLAQVVGQFFTGVAAEDFLVILQCIEVCIRRGTTRQAVAILDELDVAQTSRHATIAVGVEGVEVDADIAVAAGVDHHGVGHRLHMAVNHLRCVLAGRVQEEMLLIVFIVRTVDVTITQGHLEVRRNLTAPLTGLAILLGGLHSFVDRQQGFLVRLGDQAGNGIFRITAVDALGLEDVTSTTEYEANLFAANLLLDENSIEELVSDGFDIVQIARQLGTNVNLLLLKLQQMNDDNRFRLPDMPDRNFLGVISDDAGHL